MEGTNFIFYPPFQQNHPGDWEICSLEGWDPAANNTEAEFHMADRGRLLPSSGAEWLPVPLLPEDLSLKLPQRCWG